MSDGAKPGRKSFGPTVNAYKRSETTTLVFAVTVAVALGVACGIWLNSLLASSASAGRAAHSQPAPEVPPPADANGTSHGAVETAAAKEPAADVVEGRVLKPAAREESKQAKEDARPAATREIEKRAAPEREERRAAPCALYASASSLTIRSGGAASLVLGGPGEAGRVNVSTPNWADIAVFQEGPAAGRNGWMRYTVKSVSKRPGLYTVRFNTRCGSQTILVTVK